MHFVGSFFFFIFNVFFNIWLRLHVYITFTCLIHICNAQLREWLSLDLETMM